MLAHERVSERYTGSTPIHGWIVTFKPFHTEDEVIAQQSGDGEIESISIGGDDDRNGRQNTLGGLTMTISESD